MKIKLLALTFLTFIINVNAQITEDQTWEIYRPGYKLIYDINACLNNEPEPSTEDFFYCDGPDRVIVKSSDLTFKNIINTHIYSYNNEDFVVYATEKGLSVYNKTQNSWKNIPIESITDELYSAFNTLTDVDGKIVFSGKNLKTRIYNPETNEINTLNDVDISELKKNPNDNSIWGYVREEKKLYKYANGSSDVIDLGFTTNPNHRLKGFDIATDNKIYAAIDGFGIIVFNPNDASQQAITPDNSDLFSTDIQDVNFDENGNLWIAIGDDNNGGGKLVKWNIESNTFINYEKQSGAVAGNISFNKVEVLGNTVWLTSESGDSADDGLFKVTFENNTIVWEQFNSAYFIDNGYFSFLESYDSNYLFNNLSSYNNSLFISTVHNGTIEIENDTWIHHTESENNIPSYDSRSEGTLHQNKKGGIVFTTVAGRTDVVTYLDDNGIINYPLESIYSLQDSDQGMLDVEGDFYAIIKDHSNSETRLFGKLNHPTFDSQFQNKNISNDGSYALQGANRWYFQKEGGEFVLSNFDTNVEYRENNTNMNLGTNVNVFLAEGRDELVWTISDKVRFYNAKTDVSGELTIPDVTGKNHSTFGEIQKIIFGVNSGEMWLICTYGIIYMKDGQQKYTLSKTDAPQVLNFNEIKDFVLDESNTAYALTAVGFLKIADVNNVTPTLTEFYYIPTVSGAGPLIEGYLSIVIDNNGNKWLKDNGSTGSFYRMRLLKFADGNTAAGITNGAINNATANLDKNKKEDIFSLYPNPVSSVVNIKLKNNKAIESIAIYNLRGQQIIQQNSSNNSVDVSSLSAGIYFIKVKADHQILSKKLIIK
jgi:hypothetical protein